MRKRHLFVAVAIIMAALVLTVCDLIAPIDDTGGDQDTFGPLTITGEASGGKSVIITFKRPVQTAQKAVVTLTPQEGDTYEIYYDNQPQPVSIGSISVVVIGNGKEITFKPDNNGTQFKGTYTSGNNLSIAGGTIPGTPITEFKPVENGNNGGSSPAKTAALQLDKSLINAKAVDGNVEIYGTITVDKNIDIPDTVKLIFKSRDNAQFLINNNTNSSPPSNVTVTAKGGIEVSEGRGVKLDGTGSLVVEKDSKINGRLIVCQGATLDIAGNVTILSGGALELAGNDTAYKVAADRNSSSNVLTPAMDAVFKLRESMVVEEGGRFQMPDPYKFEVKYITGVIKVKSGGELILVTADPNGKYDLHPWIGTEYTATQGAPVGADFVMDPVNIKIESWIEVKFSGKADPIPALELTGKAIALGRLILDKDYNKPNSDYDTRVPPYRFEVWLTYPFTVTKNGELTIGKKGNSEEGNMLSTILVTGNDFSSADKKIKGINKGVLTNNGSIRVLKKNAIVEWFGGYFNHNDKVLDPDLPFKGGSFLNKNWQPYGDIDFKVWSPEWRDNKWDEGYIPGEWWPEGLEKPSPPGPGEPGPGEPDTEPGGRR